MVLINKFMLLAFAILCSAGGRAAAGKQPRMLVVICSPSCVCTPEPQAPTVVTPGCFTINQVSVSDAQSGWCDFANDECLAGSTAPRPCGTITVIYDVTHGGAGCCSNGGGTAAPGAVNIPVGQTKSVNLTFPAVKCGGTSAAQQITVRCNNNNAINTVWDVVYKCIDCTWNTN